MGFSGGVTTARNSVVGLAKSVKSPLSVVITEEAKFIATAAGGMRFEKGVYLVRPRWSFTTAAKILSAHAGLYDDAEGEVVVDFASYYNDGVNEGTPTPDAEILILNKRRNLSFYQGFGDVSTTGTLTNISIEIYSLGSP